MTDRSGTLLVPWILCGLILVISSVAIIIGPSDDPKPAGAPTHKPEPPPRDTQPGNPATTRSDVRHA
jgi:hypothetical protein